LLAAFVVSAASVCSVERRTVMSRLEFGPQLVSAAARLRGDAMRVDWR
jgi:hypothetical protein